MTINQSKNYLRVAVLTGGFDPVTPGHIEYFKEASVIADIVLVFANSDAWLTRKKGKPFMQQSARISILESIKYITSVLPLNEVDDLDNTSNAAIKISRIMYPDAKIMFMNGGDRTAENIPESKTAKELNVELVFGVGGVDKKHSSSWLLRDWKND
jgi:cytidyltransferase-like protein